MPRTISSASRLSTHFVLAGGPAVVLGASSSVYVINDAGEIIDRILDLARQLRVWTVLATESL